MGVLSRKTLSYNPLLSPFPSWLPGAAPTEPSAHLVCRGRAFCVGPSTSPTVGRGVFRAPAHLMRGEEKIPSNQSPT